VFSTKHHANMNVFLVSKSNCESGHRIRHGVGRGHRYPIDQLKGSGCGCGRAAAAIGSSVCKGTVDDICGKAGAQAWACTGGHRIRHGVGRGHRYPIDQLKGSGCGFGRAASARAPSTTFAGRQGRECQCVVVAIRLSVCCSHIVKVVELFFVRVHEDAPASVRALGLLCSGVWGFAHDAGGGT
jgi:hypothetical protein